jgi:hypothetical protein
MKHYDHENEFQNLPHSHVMFHHVESACAADVEQFCGASETQTTGDPLLDWIFLPFAPPPPDMEDLNMMMDRLFDPLFLEPSREYVTLFFVQEPQHGPLFLIDAAAAKAAKEREPEEIPQLAHDLRQYGSEMLTKIDADSSFHYQMARRLTELDAKTIQHQVHLPFGCAKNRCLRLALVEGKVSPECQSSIERLESTFTLETELEHRQELFLCLMTIYMMTLLVLAIMVHRRMGSLRSNIRLGERILQAVYGNPTSKRQVELDLGHSLGSVPPRLYGGISTTEGSGGSIKRVKVAVLALLVALVIFAPFWVLPICIILSVARVIRLCLLAPGQSDDCTCCCCGATSTDAANGTLTEAQECCSCCKGSGSCTTSCADCCGHSCCCDGSCCCCAGVTKLDGCCCCGLSMADARDGNLTEIQACCDCCMGTGTCPDAKVLDAKLIEAPTHKIPIKACSSADVGNCCSSDAQRTGKGRGEKHVVPAKNEVYCGVPLQVV